MSMASGTRIGSYEVLAALGAGGMGEVYRARDTRLHRDVALKILPESFAADPERRARFEREAQVLASLNHPHIAQIYGIEEGPPDGGPYNAGVGAGFSRPVRALVMEFVDGETLADRIARGPIPLDEALAIARQITDAIDAAHDRGIIHRDLKPANIKITSEGVAKVLDFGLAKLNANDSNGSNPPNALSMSPTITSPVMATGVGMLLGTAAYMSPEQARGKAVDKRADIWAFGCVLYEMVTGRRAFTGDDVGEVMAAVIRGEPERTAVPARLRRLIDSCLEKDPRKRLRDIGDAWRLLDDADSAIVRTPARTRVVFPWAIAALAVSAVIAMVVWAATRPAATPVTAQFTVGPSPARTFRDLFTGAAVSPNGRALVFSGVEGQQGGANLLYVRPIDELAARPLAGTADADFPFWSPDSSTIAFFADGKLKRVDLTGGTPFVLADAPRAGGGTWNRNGVLLFAARGGLYTVPASGGAASLVLPEQSASQARIRMFPMFLPDGDRFIYLFAPFGSSSQGGGIWVSSIGHPNDERQLLAATYKALYAAGEDDGPGHLLFVRDATLLAQTFDPRTLTLSGEAVPIVTDVTVAINSRRASFWVADMRTLVVGRGGSVRDRAKLAWFDRGGSALGDAGTENIFSSMRLSPDAQRIAIGVRDSAGRDDQWVLDVARRTMSRLTFDTARETWPVWSPDGQQVAFGSDRSGTYQLFRKDARGAGPDQVVSVGGSNKVLNDWSPDGRYLLYSEYATDLGDNIWAWPLSGDAKPIPVVRTPFADTSGQFSPDGKWVAYMSNESGRDEIYLQTFPPSSGKWQVSTAGGRSPRWRGDGREVFYVTATQESQAIMAVDVRLGSAGVELGTPHRLFSTSMPLGNSYPYDVTRDGQRFVVQQLLPQSAAPPLTVILNWPALLKK